jgi:hypothetical protein
MGSGPLPLEVAFLLSTPPVENPVLPSAVFDPPAFEPLPSQAPERVSAER